jgi:hypothetical protein
VTATMALDGAADGFGDDWRHEVEEHEIEML